MALWRIKRVQAPYPNPAAPLGSDTVFVQLEDTESTDQAVVLYNYVATAGWTPFNLMCALQEDLGYTPNDFSVTGCP